MLTGKINEIFHSYQGEGLYRGVPQLFIRFSGCNMQCNYCDTEHKDGISYFVKDVLDMVADYTTSVHSVSITGGEPLLQGIFLRELVIGLKKKEYKIYLETNGTLPGVLKKIISYIDIISMDFKVPSSTMCKNYWEEHQEFLKIADTKEVFIKIVITNGTKLGDLEKSVNIISEISRFIPLVLQPVTPLNKSDAPNDKMLFLFRDRALKKLEKVKIIEQIHPLLGIK